MTAERLPDELRLPDVGEVRKWLRTGGPVERFHKPPGILQPFIDEAYDLKCAVALSERLGTLILGDETLDEGPALMLMIHAARHNMRRLRELDADLKTIIEGK